MSRLELEKWIALASEDTTATKKPISKGLTDENIVAIAPATTIFDGPAKGIIFNRKQKMKTPKYPNPQNPITKDSPA